MAQGQPVAVNVSARDGFIKNAPQHDNCGLFGVLLARCLVYVEPAMLGAVGLRM
jgi:hypothetical protein